MKRVVVVLGMVSMWLALALPSCSKPPVKPPTPDMAKTNNAKGPDTNNTSQKPTKEGKGDLPEDGSIKAEDVGPKAPAVFIISGLKGYTEPCGCTADIMMGGVGRIVGYIEEAKKLYPATTMVDAGDWLFEDAEIAENKRPQERLKAELVADMHKQLGTKVTVPGVRDFALGTAFWRKMLGRSGMTAVGANVTIDGKALPTHQVVEIDGVRVGFVGVVHPETFLKDGKPRVAGVTVGPAAPALKTAMAALKKEKVDVSVALLRGKLLEARGLLEASDALDFVVVGEESRETDQVTPLGKGHALEVYDQGRYVGVLKLYKKGSGPLENARPFSKGALDAIDKRMASINERLNKLKPTSPMRAKFRKQLADLEAEKTKLKNASIQVPEGKNSFVYRAIGLRPGLTVDKAFDGKREDLNAQIVRITKTMNIPLVPPKPGEAFYVGTNTCQNCHPQEHAFWAKSKHAHAVATLEERNKHYDQSCIGCHVVGYEQPGGSVLGKLQYEYEHEGAKKTKDLRNVGCESCHGPGSMHAAAPVGANGPQHIQGKVTEKVCAGACHVPEHSPRFEFDAYVELILGEGHGKE